MTRSSGRRIAVLDVGGTTLRAALFDSGPEVLGDVSRTATAGTAGASAGMGQHRVVEQIVDTVSSLVERGADSSVVAFAGPVTADGVVLAAPTVVGSGWRSLDLQTELTRRCGIPVRVLNELTAAAWRYRRTESGPFCLITVSSGIGNKVMWGDQVLIDPAGHGGEIGHWQVDRAAGALVCECGGRGHLGAVASGRGTQALARSEARRHPSAFALSSLAGACSPETITTRDLVTAVRCGDEFATRIVRVGVKAMAAAVTAIFASIGVRRFLLIGGFVQALADRYLEMLRHSLQEAGGFGLTDSEIAAMVELGAPDDDHSLIGAGIWASDHGLVPGTVRS